MRSKKGKETSAGWWETMKPNVDRASVLPLVEHLNLHQLYLIREKRCQGLYGGQDDTFRVNKRCRVGKGWFSLIEKVAFGVCKIKLPGNSPSPDFLRVKKSVPGNSKFAISNAALLVGAKRCLKTALPH
jgi:hypothetical protein